jgi:hypothetical protein
MRKLVLAGALAALAALVSSSGAYAKGCPGVGSEPPSSIAQYVEQQQTSCGSHATGTGTETTKLPTRVQEKLDKQNDADAKLLETIATSEAYGAPQHTAKPKSKKARAETKKILTDSEARHSNPLSASVSVVTDGSDTRLIALVALMIGIAAIVLGSALRRRRVSR